MKNRMKKNIKIKEKRNKDGSIDITMTCKKCGQPIETVTDMGMFCKNMCGEQESRAAFEKMKKLFPFLK
jgi:hypothetical protein